MNTEEEPKLQWWSVAALNLFFFVGGNNNLNGTKLPPSFFQTERNFITTAAHGVCVCVCVCSITNWCVCKWSVSSLRLMHCQFDRPTMHHSVLWAGYVTLCPQKLKPLRLLPDCVLVATQLLESFVEVLDLLQRNWKKGTKTNSEKKSVSLTHTPTTMIIIFKPHPRDYDCPSAVITGGVSRPCTEPGRKSTCSYFLSQLFWTLGLQFWFYSTFVLTGSAAVATAFLPGSLPLWVPFEEVLQSLTRRVYDDDKKIWRAHAAPTQQVCLCKHLCDCAHVAVEADRILWLMAIFAFSLKKWRTAGCSLTARRETLLEIIFAKVFVCKCLFHICYEDAGRFPN